MRALPTAEASLDRPAVTLTHHKDPTIHLGVGLSFLPSATPLLEVKSLNSIRVVWSKCTRRNRVMVKCTPVIPIRPMGKDNKCTTNRELLVFIEAGAC